MIFVCELFAKHVASLSLSRLSMHSSRLTRWQQKESGECVLCTFQTRSDDDVVARGETKRVGSEGPKQTAGATDVDLPFRFGGQFFPTSIVGPVIRFFARRCHAPERPTPCVPLRVLGLVCCNGRMDYSPWLLCQSNLNLVLRVPTSMPSRDLTARPHLRLGAE